MDCVELPYLESALAYFQAIAEEPGAIWFHSGLPRREGHQWEWCSAWPSDRFSYLGNGRVKRQGRQNSIDQCSDFFRYLKPFHRQIEGSGHPFSSGLAGHFNYEIGFEQQNLTSRHSPLSALAAVNRYDWCLSLDHQHQRCQVTIHPDCPADIRARVEAFITQPPSILRSTPNLRLIWHSQMTAAQYTLRFERLQDLIVEGDVYQANLTRQWHANLPSGLNSLDLYRSLLAKVPAPYSVFHRAEDHTLMSVSPERFVTVDQNQIKTQPIKGTRPRVKNNAEDQAYAAELSASTKDRAENLMIVDLLRNDVSRNAKTGSVKVPELFKLESYSNVHHLVSTITAQLCDHSSPLDLLADAFPGGSITGAPKRRAMEIIDELELAARGPYCGSAFWYSDDGYFDSNILIRSIVQYKDKLICAGGGGIVADSQCSSEYAESATKVTQLLAALGTID